MPSFFRTAEDVRILFLRETDTPEKKKQYDRLKTIFAQSVRRGGVRGHFFFHRRSASLGGAPILILEPQGPVDRGIFQEGLTRFGETLSGTFHTPQPGHLVFETKKNLSEADALKYRRAIRRVIANITGMMASGGDDRIQIITPAHKAQRAREAAEARRADAEAARDKRRALKEARAQKRDAAPRPEKPAPPAAPPVEEPSLEERVAAREAEVRARAAISEAGVAMVRDAWEETLIGWQHQEGDTHHLDADRIEVTASIADREEHAALLEHLKHRLAPLRRPDQLHAVLSGLEDEPQLAELFAVLEVSDEPLETARRWVLHAQAADRADQETLRAERERLRTIERTLEQGRSQLERARQQAMNAQAEAIRDRIRAASQAHDAALRAGDDAARAAAGQEQAEAQAALQVVSRLQRADGAMRWIGMSLQRMADRGQTSAEDFEAQQRADAALRQALAQLEAEAVALERLGASALLETLWQSRPALAWARPLVAARLTPSQ